jgi:hypothetical protein
MGYTFVDIDIRKDLLDWWLIEFLGNPKQTREIAPVGQVTVHTPQPMQRSGRTT